MTTIETMPAAITIINAGPGSGKTERISKWSAEMIDIYPDREQVAAITFTRSAAGELYERLKRTVYVSTIHSLAYTICDHNEESDNTALGIMNYDDIIVHATAILKKEEPHIFFKALALDEAQDLTGIQYLFLKELINQKSVENVLIVGDEMQSIFGFNGGDPRWMHELIDDNPDNVISHMQTYRFGSGISSYVNKIFDTTILPNPDITSDVKVSVVRPDQTFRAIKKMIAEPLPGNAGILLRTNNEILQLLGQLTPSKYNYSLQVTRHPLVVLAVLGHTRETGMDVNDLILIAKTMGYGSYRTLKTLESFSNIRITVEELEGYLGSVLMHGQTEVQLKSILEIVKSIDVGTSYDSTISRLREAGFESEAIWDLPDVVIHYAINVRIQENRDSFHYVDNGAPVDILTIHAAKGQEYDRVINVVNPFINIYSEEETRVNYVAMTRARKHLRVVLPVKGVEYNQSRANVLDKIGYASGII